mmetsp:Transcript_15070/g.32920  ORF Transcript_15070/g.32920 Transcript_15070/m.32920 type:complete len:759 (-) Transcript_15070:31-2307(-)
MGKKSKKGQHHNAQHAHHKAGKGGHSGEHHELHHGPVYKMLHGHKNKHNNKHYSHDDDTQDQPTAKVILTVIRGEDLAPKDRDFFGRHTTSDPYVELWSHHEKIASTEPKFKDLNPVWNESFALEFPATAHKEVITLKIWDQDVLSDPDAMGVLKVPIDCRTAMDATEWMDIPPDSAKNAKGRLQVKVAVTPVVVDKAEEQVREVAVEEKPGEVLEKEAPEIAPSVEEATTTPPPTEEEEKIDFLELGLSGENVANVDSIFGHQQVDGKSLVLHRIEHGLGASDVFCEILNARDKLVARSEVWLNHLNPRFALLYIPLTKIQVAGVSMESPSHGNSNDKNTTASTNNPESQQGEDYHNIFINFYDWEENGRHQFIGHLTTTLEELVTCHGRQQSTFPLEVNVHKKYGRVRVRCARIMNDVKSRTTPIDWRFVEHDNTVDWDLEDMDAEEKKREDAAEEARLASVAAAVAKEEAEAARQADDDHEEKKVEDEAIMASMEVARLEAEAEARRVKEAEEARLAEEAEAQRLKEAEAQRLEEAEEARLAAEAEAQQLKEAEEARLAAEAQRLKAEEEAQLAAEAEAQLAAEAEAQRLEAEEEARKAAEAEEETRVAAEAEAQRLKAEEEARVAEEAAKAQRLQEQKLKEEEEKALTLTRLAADSARLKAAEEAKLEKAEAARRNEIKKRPTPLRNTNGNQLPKQERKSPSKSKAQSGAPFWERLYSHDTACLRSGRIREEYWVESPKGKGVHARGSTTNPSF